MQTHPELYPPRSRSTNIALIRGVRGARDKAEFEAADAEIARSLHPSLFSELDWMERTMPQSQRERGGALADDLFAYHLPALVTQRRVEFELAEADLASEVNNHRRFYSWVIEQYPEVVEALGPELAERIRGHLGAPAPTVNQLIDPWFRRERSRVAQLLRAVEDRDWLWLLISVEVQNAMALTLDHLPSRLAAKALVRASGGVFPQLAPAPVHTRQDVERMAASLRDIADQAAGYSLLDMTGTCRAIADVVESIDPSSLLAFSGQRAAGYGGCGTCSMMYAASSIVSFDPTCSGIFDDDKGTVYIALDLNMSTCPFCHAQSRADSPALFYAPHRNLVIYNAPRLGQFTEGEALEVHREILSKIRQDYIQRVDQEKAVAFDRANEEFTYSMPDFLMAIQMGTTAKEEHVYNLVRFQPDGSGMIVDSTKNVMIELSPLEVQARWSAESGVDQVATPDEPSAISAGPSMNAVLEAFAAQDYDRARQILEKLHAAHPGDDTVRKNLAVVYVTIGDKQAARALLQSGR
jgi:hypothetical protein